MMSQDFDWNSCQYRTDRTRRRLYPCGQSKEMHLSFIRIARIANAISIKLSSSPLGGAPDTLVLITFVASKRCSVVQTLDNVLNFFCRLTVKPSGITKSC